jgi:excinuclease ABC subunit B
MSKSPFKLATPYKPAGDQPKAILELIDGLDNGLDRQTLFGVTGSGKTFTMANVIADYGKPTLVIAHNKTLAAQLAQEYREFFPNNAVNYFVSYYDYYQPEAYIPSSDTYIEKEAMINEEIERLRHASTQALLTRKDVIIVASVSCIYGLGSPDEYVKVNLKISVSMEISRAELIRKLINIHFVRTNADLKSGNFRAVGNTIEIMPVNEKTIFRLEYDGPAISKITELDPVSRSVRGDHKDIFIFPAKHFISSDEQSKNALKTIQAELEARLKILEKEGKLLEAERLKRRVKYDLSMIREIGYTNGIENYSRHFSGKMPGEPPDSLLSYFPHRPATTAELKAGSAALFPDFLTIVDESHVTIPQLNGMYAGDASRKDTLVEHGFRLPSAKDNRPLKFAEFLQRIGPMIYTSATPSKYEAETSEKVVEQVIRPTGLIDPEVEIRPIKESPDFHQRRLSEGAKATENEVRLQQRPTPFVEGESLVIPYKGQIFDFIEEAERTIKKGDRVLATTLTKKMAEDLTEFLKEKKIKAAYLHSDVKTIERITILTDFRKGKYDILVGVNLLREGLDLPEVSLIGILDADKEGFLRSETALIQTIGRAARNAAGKVILYADNITGSIDRAIKETNRRRAIQVAYNTKHGITPQTIIKKIHDITDQLRSDHDKAVNEMFKIDETLAQTNPRKLMKMKEEQMEEAVKALDFETAALIRDELSKLREKHGVEMKRKMSRNLL